MRILALALLLSLPALAADNVLSAAEKKAGWQLLFDGKTFNHWRDPNKQNPPGDSWAIDDGTLTTRLNPRFEEDLISAKPYGDFELQFDWRVSEGGNTGLKYRLQKTVLIDPADPSAFEAKVQRALEQPTLLRDDLPQGKHVAEYTIAFEMQLIDDARHPDAKKDPNRTTGALYSMLAPVRKPAHPAGEWNHSRLVVRGKHFEHWINGELALSGSLDDPKGLENLKQRWVSGPAVYDILSAPKPFGQIMLQHHGDAVWFRNLKIREAKTTGLDF
jgi:hypothetical protein